MLRESFTEVTGSSWGVYDASEGLILKHVYSILNEFDQPTVYDFVESLQRDKVTKYGGGKQRYLDTLETRLMRLIITLRNIINCKEDYFSKLLNRNVVFRLGDLSGSALDILISWTLMKLILFKLYFRTF